MKKRILAILLIVCLFAATVSTAGASESVSDRFEDCIDLDLLVEHGISMFRTLEAGGIYDSVVNLDSIGCVGMGIMGCIDSAALQLLRWCCTPSKGGDPEYCLSILGEELFDEIMSAPIPEGCSDELMPLWGYWGDRWFTDEELAATKALLGSELGIRVQENLARYYILRQARHGWEAGVRTETALLYYCSAENHYGPNGVKGFMRAVRKAMELDDAELITSLEDFYQGTIAADAAGTVSTLWYCTRAYDHLTKTLSLPSKPDPTGPVTVITTPPSTEEPTQPLVPFTDMPEPDHWAYDAIVWAYTSTPQITNGTTPTTFAPDAVLTRAEAMTFLWNASGRPEPTIQSSSFQDVKRKSWFRAPVLWAVEQGYTNGTSATSFSPRKSVSTAEMLTFLYRFADHPDVTNLDNPFSDVSSDKYYYVPILWAYDSGLLVGNEGKEGKEDSIRPNKACTRAHVVTYLYRYFNAETEE